MKKISTLLLSLLFLINTITPISAQFVTYSFKEENGVILGFSDDSDFNFIKNNEIAIPESIDGVSIIKIGDNAFQSKEIKSIVLPDSVTELGNYAFHNSGLENINLDNIRKLGAHSLHNNKLTNINISNIEQLSEYALAGNNLTNITLNNSIQELPEYVLADNKINTINLDNIHTMQIGALTNNQLETINIPNITILQDEALSNNKLSEITLSENIIYLSDSALGQNNGFVKVYSNSTAVKPIAVSPIGYGYVKNPAVVELSFVDEDTQEKIKNNIILGLGRIETSEEAFSVGSTVAYKTEAINGYVAKNKIENITVNSELFEYTVYYKKDNSNLPKIIILDTNVPVGTQVNREFLLSKVRAEQFDRTDISENLDVSPEYFDSTVEGIYPVVYSVIDNFGKEAFIQVNFNIGKNWPEVEVGNGWVIGDFRYDKNKVIGLSKSGEEKIKTNKDLVIPEFNDKGERITIIGRGAFYNKTLESVEIHNGIEVIEPIGFHKNNLKEIKFSPNLREIGEHAFSQNKLTEVPTFYHPFDNVGVNAFSSNNIYKIAPFHPDTTRIADYVFNQQKTSDGQMIEELYIPDNVEYIGRQAFYECKVKKITSFGKSLKHIGPYAFSRSGLTGTLPEFPDTLTDIREHAFRDNSLSKLTNLPKNLETLEVGVFLGNPFKYVPNWPDNLKIVKNGAFQGHSFEGELPEFPETLEVIEYTGFYGSKNNQSGYTIPKWPSNLKRLGGYAFANSNLKGTLPAFPDSLTTIDERAFQQNNITGLTNLPRFLETISNSVFIHNKITVIPNWPENLKIIGQNTFQSNGLKEIPENFPDSLVEIQDYAFYGNNLTKPIKSWGKNLKILYRGVFQNGNKLTDIAKFPDTLLEIRNNVFDGNDIRVPIEFPKNLKIIGSNAFNNNFNLPAITSWGDSLVEIQQQAFGYTRNLRSIPQEFPSTLKLIGKWAFYETSLEDMVEPLIISPETVLLDKDTNPKSNFLYLKPNNTRTKPIIILTTDRTNPKGNVSAPGKNGLVGFVLNPTTFTIKYLKRSGEVLAPEKTYTSSGEESVTFKPEVIYGYATPDNIVSDTILNEKEIIFYYDELENIPNQNDYTLSHTAVTNDKEIGQELQSVLKFDASGSDDVLVNGEIRFTFEPERFNSFVFPRSSLIKDVIKDFENGQVIFKLNDIHPGTKLELPILWKLSKYTTQEKQNHTIKTTLVNLDSLVAIERAEDVDFKGYYSKPELVKMGNNNSYEPMISEYELKEDLSTREDTYIDYTFYLSNLQRAISEYTIIDTLPQYTLIDGQLSTAVFKPEENPGWELINENQVRYIGNSNGGTQFNNKRLRLYYPNAKQGILFKNTAEFTAEPYKKGVNEITFTGTDEKENFFYKPTIHKGQIFAKGIFSPHYLGNNKTFFLDNKRERNLEYPWILSVYGEDYGFNNVTIEDFDLDSRMLYTKVEIPEKFIGSSITLYNNANMAIWTSNLTQTTTHFPIELSSLATKATLTVKGNINSFEKVTFKIFSKLRNPDNSVYDYENETNNVFRNSSKFVGTENRENGELKEVFSRAELFVREFKQSGKLVKSQYFNTPNGLIYGGIKGEYDLDFEKTSTTVEDDLVNFKVIDLLPNGFDVEDIELSVALKNSENPNVDYVENYNGTNQRAVIITADRISLTNSQHLVKIVGVVSDDAPNGIMKNDAYMKWDNKNVKLHNTQQFNGADWSHSTISTNVIKAKELIARKYVREFGELRWGTTTELEPGKKVEFKLSLINNTDQNITDITFIDVLPNIGDYDVAGTTRGPRNSEFALENIEIVDTNGLTYSCSADVIDYATYNNKSLKDYINDLIFSQNCTNATMLKFDSPKINANSRIDIIFRGTIPNNVDLLDKTIVNSFAYKTGTLSRFLNVNNVSATVKLKPTTITFKKVGINGVALANSEFELRRKSNGELLGTTKSNNMGIVKFTGIFPDDYVIRETKAPTGYALNTKVISVTATQIRDFSGSTLNLPDYNNNPFAYLLRPIIGNIKIQKVDANGNPLSGVKFEIRGTDRWNNTVLYSDYTDDNGYILWTGLRSGNYKIKEVETKQNLVIIPEFNARIKKMNETVEINNIVNDKSQITIKKIGVSDSKATKKPYQLSVRDGSVLPNATFKIYTLENIVINRDGLANSDIFNQPYIADSKEYKTNNIGEVQIDIKKTNTVYFIEETVFPTDYTLNDNLFKENQQLNKKVIIFYVDARGQLYSYDYDTSKFKKNLSQSYFIISNLREKKQSTLVINKEDSKTKAPIQDAEFTLYKCTTLTQCNTVVETKLTNNLGKAIFTGLTGGNYKIVESKSAPTYKNNNFSKIFVVDQYAERTFEYTVSNTQINVKLVKVEMLKNSLSEQAALAYSRTLNDPNVFIHKEGTLYSVYKQLGLSNFDITKDNIKTSVEFTNGEYIMTANEDSIIKVKETKAPRGYSLNHNTITVNVADYIKSKNFNGEILIPISNNRLYGKVIVSKIDKETGKHISNVKFKLINKDTNQEFVKLTSNNGYITFDKLDWGNYSLEEVEAAEGYKPITEKKTFEITPENDTYTWIVENTLDVKNLKVTHLIAGSTVPLENSTIEIRDELDNLVFSGKLTNEFGVIDYVKVPIKPLIIKVTNVKAGYSLPTIKIGKDDTVATLYSYKIMTLPDTGTLDNIIYIALGMLLIIFAIKNKKRTLEN